MHLSLIYRGNQKTAEKFIDEQENLIKDSNVNNTSNVEVNTTKQAQGGI